MLGTDLFFMSGKKFSGTEETRKAEIGDFSAEISYIKGLRK